MAPDVQMKASGVPGNNIDGQNSQTLLVNASPRHSQEQSCGWLNKRARFSQKWRKQWFVVDKNILRYGNSDKDITKKISLEGARILESNVDSKAHAFSVQPRTGKRVYYLQADDEIGRNKWMQAICFAKMVTGVEEKGTACAIL